MKRTARVLVTGALAVGLALSATAAYGFWTIGGSGTGTATVAQIKPLTITQIDVTDLLPGGPAQDLQITVRNPNAFAVNIAEQVLSVEPKVDNDQCVFAENFLLTEPGPLPATVAADDDTSFRAGSVQLLDRPDNQNVCLGTTVTLTYVLRQR